MLAPRRHDTISAMDEPNAQDNVVTPGHSDDLGACEASPNPDEATSIREEIEAVLLAEDSLLGDVWRRTKAGKRLKRSGSREVSTVPTSSGTTTEHPVHWLTVTCRRPRQLPLVLPGRFDAS
jgi:hypothetical protein